MKKINKNKNSWTDVCKGEIRQAALKHYPQMYTRQETRSRNSLPSNYHYHNHKHNNKKIMNQQIFGLDVDILLLKPSISLSFTKPQEARGNIYIL